MGEHDSEARRALEALVRPERPTLTAADVARRLGVTPQAVGQWLAGRSRPRRELRARLVELGVPDAWD